jgi:oxaloacetate decarboxylase gamma subunit
MEENLELALSLMIIGMSTVFAILFLVVAGGKIMIRWVNKFHPDTASELIFMKADKKKLAAIIAAVNIITRGKGKIKSINKIE